MIFIAELMESVGLRCLLGNCWVRLDVNAVRTVEILESSDWGCWSWLGRDALHGASGVGQIVVFIVELL